MEGTERLEMQGRQPTLQLQVVHVVNGWEVIGLEGERLPIRVCCSCCDLD